MSGKERCLSERQIFEYQVVVIRVKAKNFTFQEAFKKFDTSTTGQVKTKLLGDILRQLSFNPTKNELQVHRVCSDFWSDLVLFLKDLTIQVDPNATGVLKLPNLLDIMSKIVDDENHDGQIMDAFKWAILNINY